MDLFWVVLLVVLSGLGMKRGLCIMFLIYIIVISEIMLSIMLVLVKICLVIFGVGEMWIIV